MALLEMGSVRLLEAKTEYAEENIYFPMFLDALRELLEMLKTAEWTLSLDISGSVGRELVAKVDKKLSETQQFLDSVTQQVTLTK
ncbi:hypothetical protein Pcinc_017907 [Petrolisthes cinctipes]|nr:hypothetical protein Pcinc_017907 [Petrolisthes cinctipes]